MLACRPPLLFQSVCLSLKEVGCLDGEVKSADLCVKEI